MTANYLADTNIKIGEHVVFHIGPLAFNLDTIIGTVVAGLIVIGLGLWVRRKVTAGVPNKGQLVFETITDQVESQVESTLGIKTAPWVVPLAMALFLFILIANWLALIPTNIGGHEWMPPPASDVNLTYALALIVIISMHVTGVRRKGVRRYYHHMFKPHWAMFPINLIEEITKPVTLALRLFGNIFSGTIMVALIGLFPFYILWAPEVVWKLFDLFIGAVQAFIFGLLTVLYFGSIAPEPEGQAAH